MGHWLDGLFDIGGTSIEWNGTPLPDEETLAFGEEFEVANDPSNGRNVVTIRFVELEGDVTEYTDENIVTSISGDLDEGVVVMHAVKLAWDADVSEGEAEIRISEGELDGGALELVHNEKRAFLALGSGPVLGNDEGINLLEGGLRARLRSIASNVNLDTDTKDTIAWIDASSERSVKMPPPTAGRIVFFPVDGSSTTTLTRNGSEQINGVAGNYVMPLDDDGGIGIGIADGTNWIARVIRFVDDAGGGGGGSPAMSFSPVDFLTSTNTAPTAATGADQSMGTFFFILAAAATVEITGVRFYWAGTGNETVRCSLWVTDISTAAAQKTVDVVTAGAGYYTGTFATPYVVPTNQYNADMVVGLRDVGGNAYTWIGGSTSEITAHLPARPFLGGSRIGFRYFNRFAPGASYPGTDDGNEWNIIEPVIQEV
jgi:hypothetical protein